MRLRSHFEPDCSLMKEPNTTHYKSFGLVTCACGVGADTVMSARPHKVDGNVVETNRTQEKVSKTRCPVTYKKVALQKTRTSCKR